MDERQQAARTRDEGITPERAKELLDALTEIVSRASAATVATCFSDVERRIKDDSSPVTAADEASEAVIRRADACLYGAKHHGRNLVIHQNDTRAAPLEISAA